MRNGRLMAVGAVTALLTTLSAPVDAGTLTQKVPLHRLVDKTCDGEDAGERPVEANGAVTFRVNRRDQVVARVVLRDAGPRRTYHVRLVTRGVEDCLTFDGQLTTNAQGNGSVTVSEARTSVVFVFVSWPNLGHEPDGSGDYFSTPTVLLP